MAKRKNRTCMNRLKRCKSWDAGAVEKKATAGRILKDKRTPIMREEITMIGKNGRPLKNPRRRSFLYGWAVEQFHATKGPRRFLVRAGGGA